MENRVEILMEELTGALIGLAKVCGNGVKTPDTDKIFIKALALTGDSVVNEKVIIDMTRKVRDEKTAVVPNCQYCQTPCVNTGDYDMLMLKNEAEEVRRVKEELLRKIREAARTLLNNDKYIWYNKQYEKIYDALCKVSYDLSVEKLNEVLMQFA